MSGRARLRIPQQRAPRQIPQQAHAKPVARRGPQPTHPLGRLGSLGNAAVQRAVRSGAGMQLLLRRALSAEEKARDLKSVPFAGHPRLEAAYDNNPPIKRGARGEAVGKVQQALIDDGFDMPISTRKTGAPDGIFGRETFRVVKQFQGKYGLKQDGIVGRETLGKMDQLSSGQAPEEAAEKPSQGLRETWLTEVLAPLAEAADLLTADTPDRDVFAGAYERLKQAVSAILSVETSIEDNEDVELEAMRTVRQLYLQVMMLGRGLQPFIGVKTDFEDLLHESKLAETIARELEPGLAKAAPAWSDGVVRPISEASATIHGGSPSAEALAAARKKLFQAGRNVRAAAIKAGAGTLPGDRLRLWRFYMQITMLERGLHPYTGTRLDVSRIRDEIGLARDTAAELAAGLP